MLPCWKQPSAGGYNGAIKVETATIPRLWYLNDAVFLLRETKLQYITTKLLIGEDRSVLSCLFVLFLSNADLLSKCHRTNLSSINHLTSHKLIRFSQQ